MKFLILSFLLAGSSLCWAQPQTKSQCVATLRARSMSISSADAEKICSEDSADIGNCVVTKMQGSHKGGMKAALTDCRKESQWNSPTPTPTPTASATAKPGTSGTPLKVPIKEILPQDEDSKKADQESFEEI